MLRIVFHRINRCGYFSGADRDFRNKFVLLARYRFIPNSNTICSTMENLVSDHVEFVRTLCLKGNKHFAKQWAGLSVLERIDVAQAVKSNFKDDVDRLTEDLYALPWCARFVDYLDSLLHTEGSPKLVVVKLPAKKPVYSTERASGKKPFTVIFKRRFDDAHSAAREKTTRLAKLLFFKAVRRFGHLNVEYTTKFFKRVSRRSNDVYGNPRTKRVKVRVVNAIRDASLSRKFYAAGPAVWNEADLTVVFARTFPNANSVPEKDIALFRIAQIAGVYKVRKQLSVMVGNVREKKAISDAAVNKHTNA